LVLVYSETVSDRLKFITGFLFSQILNLEYKLTCELNEYESYSGSKINYSLQNLGGISIRPEGILNEVNITPRSIEIGHWKDLPVIFYRNGNVVPFDIFGASFYLITRYEEYLSADKDGHGRFKSEHSILKELDVLHRPIVDLWALKLYEILTGKISLSRQFSYLSTVDVDNAYAYKHKQFWVKLAGTFKSILNGDWPDFKRRCNVYFRNAPDPYDTYSIISKTHEKYKLKSIFFFLLSDRSTTDRNLRYTNKFYRALISEVTSSPYTETGIHPGYDSYLKKEVSLLEKMRLEDIVDNQVINSRQHYLRFSFPETPRILSENGIEHDYTLCYAEEIGFRTGTSTPFKFYDLEKNHCTDLVLHTSAIMDATLNRYMNLAPEDVLEKIKPLVNDVKKVGGELVTIWHNETLSELREWKGWSVVFEQIINEIVTEKNGSE